MNDSQKQKLIAAIKKVFPAVIKEVNDVRIPALEQAWGRSYKEEMLNEKQKTVETAKNYARPLNNAFFRHINLEIPEFKELTIDGSDYSYEDVLIEDKNSFTNQNFWVGNGFKKTPIHILKKFQLDEHGRIKKVFAALVDLDKCQSSWSDRSINTNRSMIKFASGDVDQLNVLFGSVKVNRKYIKPILSNL